jgi:hypothetical protein
VHQPPGQDSGAADRDLVLAAPGQHAAQPGRRPVVQHRRHVDQAAPPVRVLQARDPAQAPRHRLHRAGARLAGRGLAFDCHRALGQHPQRRADPGVAQGLHQRLRPGQPGGHGRVGRQRRLVQRQQRQHPGDPGDLRDDRGAGPERGQDLADPGG